MLGSQIIGIRILDLKGCVAEQKKEVLDEHVAEGLPAVTGPTAELTLNSIFLLRSLSGMALIILWTTVMSKAKLRKNWNS